MTKTSEEYKRFDQTMRQLMRVSHAELKAKLDAEKAAKQKRKAATTASAKKG